MQNSSLPSPRFLGVIAALVFFAISLAARDVTVTAPEFSIFAENASDTAPTIKRKWKPDYPWEMRSHAEPGYVIVTQYVDETGKRRIVSPVSTHPLFEQSVLEELSSLNCSPATKDGKPAPSYSWISIIFNPSEASTSAPEATARILKVTPIYVTPKQWNAFPKSAPVVRASIAIDAAGTVTDVTLDSKPAYIQAILPDIKKALTNWQFSPARAAGEPVQSILKMVLAVQVMPDPKKKISDNHIPPKLKDRVDAIYPYALKRSGMTGAVTVRFVVNTEGKVENASVYKSNHPGFEQAALDAVSEWRFSPATIDGKPVKTRMQIPISFNLDGDRGADGGGAYTVNSPSTKQMEKTPEGFRFDTPPVAKNVVEPVYPYEQLRDGVKGKTTVVVAIGERGTVIESVVKEATVPEFGMALQAALEAYSFTPALLEGRQTNSVLRVEKSFNNLSAFVSREDFSLLSLEKKNSDKIVSVEKLDSKPKVVSRKETTFKQISERENLTSAKAVVEYLVDTEGQVRLPRIISTTNTAWAYAAVQFISSWRYEVPKVNGKPVVVRMQEPFTYKARPSSASSGKQQ